MNFENEWITPGRKQEILDLREQAREHRRQFEAQQREKGMVQFEYLWVTPEHAEELRNMEQEINELHDEIARERQIRAGLVTTITGVSGLEEADQISKRIDELTKSIKDMEVRRLGDLIERADEIEASSVRYVMPEKFREAFPSAEESEDKTSSPHPRQ